MMAIDNDRLFQIQLRPSGGQISKWYQGAPRKPANLVFLRLSHIEKTERLSAIESLL
jgi:hypothetical protein